MSKNLVIVESPAKAKTIEKFLGKNYKVMASIGHIRDLPKSKLGVDIENDFEPQYINIRGKGDKIKELKSAAKKVDHVFLATDPDREGEAIAWHLAYLLGIDPLTPCRVSFHEITKDAVKTAIQHPRELNLSLVDAQQARRIMDRLVGYSISPVLWRKVRKGLSAGRVQSVATKLIVDRETVIRNFIKEEYWSIEAELKKKSGEVASFELIGKGGKKLPINQGNEADAIEKELEGVDYIVKNVTQKVKHRSPSPCFTTSSLQQEAANRYGYTTKKTMMIAQQLYEGVDIKGEGSVGLITYMRTDSTRISEEARGSLRTYITENFSEDFLNQKARKQTSKKNAQEAHEAIRPTYVLKTPVAVAESLTKEQLQLYTLIWERFVASEMADAAFDSLTIDVANGAYDFRANGSRMTFPGFMKVYTSATYTETILPSYEEGEVLKPQSLEKEQHFTQPPARYTEASLVKEMEELGIGRPSTYAPTISTIISRGYVDREKKSLKPTELGEITNDIMNQFFLEIINVDFTAKLENDLDRVEAGEEVWKRLIRDFYPPFADAVVQADAAIEKVDLTEKTDIPCEKCGEMMNIKHGRFGKFLACSNYPTCQHTKPILNEIGVKCPVCGIGEVVERKTKKLKNFYGCSRFPECRFVSWNKPMERKCPTCGEYLFEKITKSKHEIQCSDKNCKYVEKI